MSTKPVKRIDTKMSFQMYNASICGIMKAAFVLDSMPLNAAFQTELSNNKHSDLTHGVIFWGVISYHGRSNWLRVEGNFSTDRYVCEVLSTARSRSLLSRRP
ncbi:hypothetical protein TNCV_2798831 [Trichonephila clavipes]|nr:hypothetical protein TNCV_2798831 [Trichonephila clavipes]